MSALRRCLPKLAQVCVGCGAQTSKTPTPADHRACGPASAKFAPMSTEVGLISAKIGRLSAMSTACGFLSSAELGPDANKKGRCRPRLPRGKIWTGIGQTNPGGLRPESARVRRSLALSRRKSTKVGPSFPKVGPGSARFRASSTGLGLIIVRIGPGVGTILASSAKFGPESATLRAVA